jgi:hypothetical protein
MTKRAPVFGGRVVKPGIDHEPVTHRFVPRPVADGVDDISVFGITYLLGTASRFDAGLGTHARSLRRTAQQWTGIPIPVGVPSNLKLSKSERADPGVWLTVLDCRAKTSKRRASNAQAVNVLVSRPVTNFGGNQVAVYYVVASETRKLIRFFINLVVVFE